MARFAVTDIHGCAKTLKKLVQETLGLTKADTLYLLGDYIDRGPDSKGVLDFILQLQEDGYDVQCLTGNHEIMLLNAADGGSALDGWLRNGGEVTLASFEVSNIGFIPQIYWEFFHRLKLFISLDDYLLVHAGFNFKKDDIFEDKYAMLWIRNWYNEYDATRINNRKIVHGHTPTHYKLIQLSLQHKQPINIDAGCVYKGMRGLGYLCAYNLDEQSLIFESNIDIE